MLLKTEISAAVYHKNKNTHDYLLYDSALQDNLAKRNITFVTDPEKAQLRLNESLAKNS